MRKLTVIITLLVLFFSFPVFGQVEVEKNEDDKPVIELGLNTTFLLFRLLNFNGSAEVPTTETYFATFKRIKGKNAFRSALGFDFVINPDFFFSSNTRAIFFKTRIGYERQIPLLKRFQINTGVDLFTQINTNKSRTFTFSGNLIIQNRVTSDIGLSSFLAFEFKLTDRLSLFTETELAYHHHKTVVQEPSRTFPLQRKTIEKGDRLIFSLPLTLFFSIKF